MPPQGITNDEDRQQELPEEGSTPFSVPIDVQEAADDTHQQADTNVDAHEQYDEGVSGAIEVNDPGSRGILGYQTKESEEQ